MRLNNMAWQHFLPLSVNHIFSLHVLPNKTNTVNYTLLQMKSHSQDMRSKHLLSSGTSLIWQVRRLTRVGGLVSSAWQISRKPSAWTRHLRFCQTLLIFPSDFLRRWPVRVTPWCLSPCSWCSEYPAPFSPPPEVPLVFIAVVCTNNIFSHYMIKCTNISK